MSETDSLTKSFLLLIFSKQVELDYIQNLWLIRVQGKTLDKRLDEFPVFAEKAEFTFRTQLNERKSSSVFVRIDKKEINVCDDKRIIESTKAIAESFSEKNVV